MSNGKILFFKFISKLPKICWKLEAVQTIAIKGREIADHKQAASYVFGNKMFPIVMLFGLEGSGPTTI